MDADIAGDFIDCPFHRRQELSRVVELAQDQIANVIHGTLTCFVGINTPKWKESTYLCVALKVFREWNLQNTEDIHSGQVSTAIVVACKCQRCALALLK